jgi:hypothetical protein
MALVEVVLDPGPIAYPAIELHGDPDLEQALTEDGLRPSATCYRLIEIPLQSITDTRWLARREAVRTALMDALEAGAEVPPVVVKRNLNGWGLLDGVNRTYALMRLGRSTIRAYELIT